MLGILWRGSLARKIEEKSGQPHNVRYMRCLKGILALEYQTFSHLSLGILHISILIELILIDDQTQQPWPGESLGAPPDPNVYKYESGLGFTYVPNSTSASADSARVTLKYEGSSCRDERGMPCHRIWGEHGLD
jgi:hypothetical protein